MPLARVHPGSVPRSQGNALCSWHRDFYIKNLLAWYHIYSMDFLYSSLFVHIFFVLSSFTVSGVVLYSYFKKVFPSKIAWMSIAIIVLYISSFLLHRYASGHMSEHAVREPSYVLLSALHGTVSLVAITLTVIFFVRAQSEAQRGVVYFSEHLFLSILIPTTWFLSLISGWII